ncbi:uncharacterized protein A1O5_06469 [Cladophialophora psammophila CBS 110553]|uniref:Xylanolytic transcriptional activator regulatory domain-containing protein n=1 Tax=Cladophialophora psammophila CBS 110553 TaxID=1182543 RepID=W9X0H6_9EURO|nr:uncharacterized protein A1O5_06469 [Cladophialophora psammophila CBS 110553]EXJ70401.1 hypothetical protein A1O5_06469 [Cladophialophora psammophila CBS 110553]
MARRYECLEQAIEELRQVDNAQVQSILRKAPLNPSSVIATNAQHSSMSTSSKRDSVESLLAFKTAAKSDYYSSTSAVDNPSENVTSITAGREDSVSLRTRKESLVRDSLHWQGFENIAVEIASIHLHLPAKSIQQLLQTHWTWVHPVFMFVYRPSFMKNLVTGGSDFSPLLLSAVCAHSTRFTDQELSGQLLSRARLLLGQEIHNTPTMSTIQALLQLSALEIGKGMTSQAWLLSGMAFRMATDIGLFAFPPQPPDVSIAATQGQEMKTRLAWGCFLWDKAISLYLGRMPALPDPPSVQAQLLDDTAETEPWIPIFDGEPVPSRFPPTPASTISCFTNFCQLGVILTDIIINVYGRQASNAVLEFIQKASARLSSWRAATPAHLKVAEDAQNGICPPPHVLSQNLLYHTALILLHRPFQSSTTCRTICRKASEQVEQLLLRLKNTFGFTRVTYLMAYCTYTAATIAVQDLREGLAGSSQRTRTYLSALTAVKSSCPGIQRSVDIIMASIGSSWNLDMLEDDLPDSYAILASHPMPAFPFYDQNLNAALNVDFPGPVFNPQHISTLDSFPENCIDFSEEVLNQYFTDAALSGN